jgi:hypothetical protein
MAGHDGLHAESRYSPKSRHESCSRRSCNDAARTFVPSGKLTIRTFFTFLLYFAKAD